MPPAQESGGPPTASADTFNDAVLGYFDSHGIDPGVAAVLGLTGTERRIAIPYRKHQNGEIAFVRERDFSTGKTYQPKGTKLMPWTPVGTEGCWLLVCEGESDCMAAISAIYEVELDAVDPLEAIRPRPDLPPSLMGGVPVAIPGVATCHGRIPDLVENLGADVCIVFDGDGAGRAAAKKLKKTIEARADVSVVIIDLPDDRDLADVLAAADDPTAALAELVAEAEAVQEDFLVEAKVEEPPRVEPLPPDVVGGVLGAALDFVDRYVVLPGDHERHALVLWIAHTWALAGAHATPYLLTVSPEKRSGKTRLQEVAELLVARPWRVTGASEAAVFRKIAKTSPTLLLDEIDAIFGSHSERTEPLRAILNAGNRPGATVARCVGENKDVEDFPIYCPKMLSGIDKGQLIPDTIRDRAITITMVRRTPAEPLDRFRHRTASAEAEPIRTVLQRWSAGAGDLLLAADPDLPVELDDRAAEAWEPLLAIADMAEDEWPARARAAAVALSGQDDRDEVTTGTLLLGAIKEAFGDADRMTSADIRDTINADEELPFGGWREGRGLDARRLAKLLRPYGVKPRVIRLDDGSTPRGYLREQFTEVWERWLPLRTEAQHAQHAQQDPPGATQIPLVQANVAGVAGVADSDAEVSDVAGVAAGCASHDEPVAGCRYCAALIESAAA